MLSNAYPASNTSTSLLRHRSPLLLRQRAIADRAGARGVPLIGYRGEGLGVDDFEPGGGAEGWKSAFDPLRGNGGILQRVDRRDRVYVAGDALADFNVRLWSVVDQFW